MKCVNKIILAGLAALWAACSNDTSVDTDLSGATTEPNTSQTAKLTEEQKAILERSFYTLVDTVVIVPDNMGHDGVVVDSSTVSFYKLIYPFFGIIPDTTFAYPSLDTRRKCNVSTFSAELGMEFSQSLDTGNVYYSEVYNKKHYSSMIAVKVLDVDGDSVIMKTVGSTTYWGYDSSCSEFLTQFKQSCTESNGIFKDLGDGCRRLDLSLACSMIIPEGKSPADVIDSLTGEYKNACREDSIKYAPVDDENNAPKGCFAQIVVGENGETTYSGDCPQNVDDFDEDLWRRDSAWRMGVVRTLDAYAEQFAVYKETIDGMIHYYNHTELLSDAVAYNSFPDADEAKAYREEGVYRLPDSLLAVFFPTASNSPRAYTAHQGEDGGMAYYIIVLKDVGAKGHALNKVDASGIYVRDVVKSGEGCPEDNAEYYSVFLIRGSTEWDVSEKEIIRSTFVSPLWNCADSGSIELIEPYGEWTNRDAF